MFAVIVTGAPGAGKTTTLMALSDALVADAVAHAAGDVDELAWAYPFPGLDGRCEHLRTWAESHRATGCELLLVAEVIESPEHLEAVLAAIGAGDHLLVRLTASMDTMRARIVAREPPGWHSLEHLLDEVEPLDRAQDQLDGVGLVVDTVELSTAAVAERIRAACPERLQR
ncbi:MAG: AAA family ATPase [Thermoleophilaceae bacterium]|nr:AAA family ATPase [Thermoleophilaceae bacterium]